ncbi:penicillin-binding protein 2 [uncultured Trichococcus sp.]|uniref:peptidoglycan D,D-transpeptidase FtsI family protein n=1 Tax=uncultured Trichococcus sp. TaxID=189665 RepID=UPI002A189584|nr:penicillin-binding protein 2 [uncultured Trichococcus sp.]
MEDNTQSKRKRKSHIPFRLNLLFFIVFSLFSAVIFRLGYLQIVRGDEFEAIVKRTETTLVTESVPRGLIYDRDGNILVGNEPQHSITYTRGANTTAKEMAKVASSLAGLINVSIEELTERDLKDYWMAVNNEVMLERLSDDEKLLPGSELYEVELEKVTAADIAYSDEEKEIAAIFKRMNSAYALSTTSIKNKDVSDEELARVSEKLSGLSGVDVATDWVRIYPESDLLKSILGGVTSEKIGLPSDKVATYLAKGYARNDRVGNSYLEQEYESVLSGTKSQWETITDQSGEVVTREESYEGKAGDNLVLTIDIDFQKEIEQIATDFLNSNVDSYNDRIYIVASDPNTGEILGMTGKQRSTSNEIVDDALGVINSSYGMGSAVKGAMVLTGYMSGVISTDNNVLVDEPLQFQGSNLKKSVFNPYIGSQVAINDIEALARSSNIYMIKLAMLMGGQSSYESGGTLNISPDLINELRSYFAQFGLGVKTGIDLPNEGSGLTGFSQAAVNVVDQSFGQYDLYTTLQLSQYINTIANGGTRYAPQLVSEIRSTDANGSLGALETTLETKVMNQVDVDAEAMERVQQGFYQVTHSTNGTAYSTFGKDPNNVAAKTGTAEAFYDGNNESLKNESVFNSTFVGYAPFDNPEITVTVVVPYLRSETGRATPIAKKVFDAYFNTGDYAAAAE